MWRPGKSGACTSPPVTFLTEILQFTFWLFIYYFFWSFSLESHVRSKCCLCLGTPPAEQREWRPLNVGAVQLPGPVCRTVTRTDCCGHWPHGAWHIEVLHKDFMNEWMTVFHEWMDGRTDEWPPCAEHVVAVTVVSQVLTRVGGL